MIPVSPPSTKKTMKPPMKSSGVSNCGRAGRHRHQPREDLDRRRDHDQHRRRGEEDQRHRRQAGREHVVREDAEADERDEQLGHRDERERDHPPPRERRDDRRRDPERGQDDDVDLGVPEDPEEVLPEQRVAAARRRRRSGSRAWRCSSRKTQSTVSGGSAKSSANATARIAKQKSGIRFSDMPGARSLKIVDDEVDRGRGRRDAVEDQPERVEVDVAARGCSRFERERHVVEPAGVRRRAERRGRRR